MDTEVYRPGLGGRWEYMNTVVLEIFIMHTTSHASKVADRGVGLAASENDCSIGRYKHIFGTTAAMNKRLSCNLTSVLGTRIESLLLKMQYAENGSCSVYNTPDAFLDAKAAFVLFSDLQI